MTERISTSGITRRRVIAMAGALPAVCAAPAFAQNALKGTKLTVLASNWYVPGCNTQLDQLAADIGRDTGMEVRIERFAGDELTTKTAAVVGSGRGADLAVGAEFDTYVYAPKLADVTALADEIGKNYGGWLDSGKAACVVDGRWKSLCIGQAPAAWNYRTDQFAAVGLNAFPDTFEDLLKAAKLLHAKGTPIGMTLGHATGDGRSANYPVLWAFGGKEFESDGKTVAINSPGTLKAVEWYAEIYKYFIPGTTAWLDPDNNQAFLTGKISATVNVNTIYLASRTAAATDPARKHMIENMAHGNWPSGPAGRFGNYNINVWLPFASSPNKAGQLHFLREWYSRKFLLNWT